MGASPARLLQLPAFLSVTAHGLPDAPSPDFFAALRQKTALLHNCHLFRLLRVWDVALYPIGGGLTRAGPRVRPLDGGRGGWLGGLYSPQPPAPTYAPPGVFQANGRKGAKVMMAETCGDSKRACPIPPSSPDRCHNFTPCCQPCKHPRCRQAGQGQMVSAQSTTHPFPHGIPVGLIRHHAPGFPVM